MTFDLGSEDVTPYGIKTYRDSERLSEVTSAFLLANFPALRGQV